MVPKPALRARGAWRRRCVAVGLLLAGSVTAPEGVAAEEAPRISTGASFFDSFPKLDRKRWVASDGWTNGAYHGCTWSAANARLTSEGMRLILNHRRTAARPYSCGELQTREFHGHGTYEVRLRSVAAPGVVSAFFSYTGPPHGPGRPQDEIDIAFVGNNPGRVQLNYVAKGEGAHERGVELGFDPAAAMNDYAFQWTPDVIRWYVNRKLVHEVKRDAARPFPTQPAKIMLSIWTGIGPDQEAWMGRLQYTGSPLVATYEHVAFTVLGEPCRFPASVLCGDGSEPERQSR